MRALPPVVRLLLAMLNLRDKLSKHTPRLETQYTRLFFDKGDGDVAFAM